MALSAADLIDDATSTPSSDALSEVSALVSRQIELEDAIAETERRLKELQRSLAKVTDHDLPAAMNEHGLKELRMADGSQVKIRDIVRASIPKKHADEAIAWLEEHGFGDLVKREVVATFGRGEDAEAQASIEALHALGLDPTTKCGVHSSTLSAFVREQIERGTELPTELLGIYVGQQSKISRAK